MSVVSVQNITFHLFYYFLCITLLPRVSHDENICIVKVGKQYTLGFVSRELTSNHLPVYDWLLELCAN